MTVREGMSGSSHSIGRLRMHVHLCAAARHDIRISTRNMPFADDLQMGPLLGQGSFGKVYRAIWNGAPVAVKVRAC